MLTYGSFEQTLYLFLGKNFGIASNTDKVKESFTRHILQLPLETVSGQYNKMIESMSDSILSQYRTDATAIKKDIRVLFYTEPPELPEVKRNRIRDKLEEDVLLGPTRASREVRDQVIEALIGLTEGDTYIPETILSDFQIWSRERNLPALITDMLLYVVTIDKESLQKRKSQNDYVAPSVHIKAAESPVSEKRKEKRRSEGRFHVPSPSPWFTGRTKELAEISSQFRDGKEIVFVTAPGGFGKTQLAKKYAQDCSAAFSDVFWINEAGDPSRIVDQYADYISESGVSVQDLNRDGILAQFKQLLANKLYWLLVYETANCAENSVFNELRSLLPSDLSNGRILITARNYRRLPGAYNLTLPTFEQEKDAAADFIVNRSADDDREAASELAERLGYHPLAMEIAAAYIAVTPAFTTSKYVAQLKNSIGILQRAPEITDYNETLHHVILSCIASIKSDNSRMAAASYIEDFLCLCAFSSPHHIIPEALPCGFPDDPFGAVGQYMTDEENALFAKLIARQSALTDFGHDELNRNDLLTLALRYGLITESGDGRLEMHELVQEVIRDDLGSIRIQAAFASYYNRKFTAFYNSIRSNDDAVQEAALLNPLASVNILIGLLEKIAAQDTTLTAAYYRQLSECRGIEYACYVLEHMQKHGRSKQELGDWYRGLISRYSNMYDAMESRTDKYSDLMEYDSFNCFLATVYLLIKEIAGLGMFADALRLADSVTNAVEIQSSRMAGISYRFFSVRGIRRKPVGIEKTPDGYGLLYGKACSPIERIVAMIYACMVGYLKSEHGGDETLICQIDRFFEMVKKYTPADEPAGDQDVIDAREKTLEAFRADDPSLIPDTFKNAVVFAAVSPRF